MNKNLTVRWEVRVNATSFGWFSYELVRTIGDKINARLIKEFWEAARQVDKSWKIGDEIAFSKATWTSLPLESRP